MTDQKLADQAFSFTPDQMVELFQLDCSPLGGTSYFFTPSGTAGSNYITFGGIEFTPLPIESEGWEMSGQGTLPEPKIRLGNANRLITGLVVQYDHLLGCVLTRYKTHRRFLDDGTDPDPDVYYDPDIFSIERLSKMDKFMVEFELRAKMDQQGLLLPKRQVLRDTCGHTYRIFDPDTGDFNYTQATCSYAGTRMFTIAGVSTSEPSMDVCNKNLSSCEDRFQNQPLPTRAFPAVAKTRPK